MLKTSSVVPSPDWQVTAAIYLPERVKFEAAKKGKPRGTSRAGWIDNRWIVALLQRLAPADNRSVQAAALDREKVNHGGAHNFSTYT
jgi:hypothetical protein